jgi:hypothetical protein
MFQFPYPVPDPADLPPPSAAQQFFATIAMLLLLFGLGPVVVARTIQPTNSPHHP